MAMIGYIVKPSRGGTGRSVKAALIVFSCSAMGMGVQRRWTEQRLYDGEQIWGADMGRSEACQMATDGYYEKRTRLLPEVEARDRNGSRAGP